MDTISGVRCAVKCLALVGQGQEVRNEELKRWQELRHPNVARCFDHALVGGELHIYHECVASGSLAAFLACFGPADAKIMSRMTRGILEGLQYLHTRHPVVVHGNLKGTNVLVSTQLQVKLTDYGSSMPGAAFINEDASLAWAAPEVVRGEAHDGTLADIWSLGCVMVEMATAEPPWSDNASSSDVREALLKASQEGGQVLAIPNCATGPARDMVAQCLQGCPSDRPSSSVLLWHSFVSEDGA